MLRLENVTFSYEKGNEIIKDISLKIEKGKKIVFLRENGSGKSTLFLIMNGLHKPEKGNLYFEGEKFNYKK
ncbi:MAG: ATP-binding cassette domain-containing protein, partial [Sebaldella sp.]|nr:ATP-binding cassette domain-containing protein [Sebaldella sp.]